MNLLNHINVLDDETLKSTFHNSQEILKKENKIKEESLDDALCPVINKHLNQRDNRMRRPYMDREQNVAGFRSRGEYQERRNRFQGRTNEFGKRFVVDEPEAVQN